MASPFRVFRKYQKTLLVIAGVICMFVFVVGDSLMSYFAGTRNARAGNDPQGQATAVHWDGGTLTSRQLNELVSKRRMLNAFLNQVQFEGERTSRDAGIDPPPLRVQRLSGPDSPQEGVQRSVVQTKLLAEAARKSGMKVSDEALRQYLDDLGRGKVSRETMRFMLKGSGGAGSIDLVLDALREEMLARNFINSQQFMFQTITPQQRWKDWLRVNERVVIEAAGITAESYMAKVKDPTDAELTAFFDQPDAEGKPYKEREASPELAYGTTELPSAIPGFKIPRKVDLQIIQANYDEFLAKAEAKVTDAEVSKYYDEHKKLFEKADMGLMEDKGPKKDGKKSETPATKDGAKSETKPGKTQDAEKKKADKDSKKGAEPKTGESKTAPQPEKKSADNPPADSKKSPADSNEQKKAGSSDGKKSSDRSDPLKSKFRLAAFEQDTKAKNDEKTDKGTEKAKEKSAEKPATTPDAKAGSPADKPAATPPAAPPDATKPTGPVLPLSPPAGTAPAAPKKPVEYQPLSEVKDLIRKQLAEGKVVEELTQLATEIQRQLDSDYNAWLSAKLAADADNKPAPEVPKSLQDISAIAEKNGLKATRTGAKSLLEIREMPVGKSALVDTNRGLLPLLFAGHDLELYEPKTTADIDGNRYILVKTSDTPARVPTLDEIRADVIKVWKKQKASEMALQHADELAKKAQEAKMPLTTMFESDKTMKVVRTDPFSELTGGDVGMVNGQFQPQPYRLSQPEGIVAPGPAFMTRVFELKDGEVGTALNHDHSIAYVIRMVEHQPPMAELRTNYLAEANSWTGLYNMTQGHVQEVWGNLINDLTAGQHLVWDKAPDTTTQGEPRGED